MTTLKEQLTTDIKDTMRAQNKPKLAVLRLISAAVKQVEVDERIDVDDKRMLAILSKMSKQRNESITHYTSAGRNDLIEQEVYELSIIQHYLPAPLSDAELETIIAKAFDTVEVKALSDMGKLMAHVKPLIEGRADMGSVSARVKTLLAERLG